MLSTSNSTLSTTNSISNIHNMSKLSISTSSLSWADASDDSPVVSSTNSMTTNTGNPIKNNWNNPIPTSITGVKTPPLNIQENTQTYPNEFVSKYINENIRLSDSDGDIRLFHYVDCDDNSSNEVKSYRGIIRDGDNIVCKTFGYTPEISCENIDLIKSSIQNFDQCRVYDSEEGATVRLWFETKSGEWVLSTHRKINAYTSRWGNPKSKSFGEMFLDALYWECTQGKMISLYKNDRDTLFSEYTNSLDKNKTYAFLIRNSNENRIVCSSEDHPIAYFIGSFDRTNNHLLTEGNDSGFPYPQSHKFDTIESMVSYVDNIDFTQKQGLIVYLNNQTQVKIMNKTYLDLFAARGNEPSIKYRYLQVRNDQTLVGMLYTLYPEYIPMFEMYEDKLADVAKKIHRAYITRFINHQYVQLPQPEYFVLQLCHGWHIQDRVHNKISLEKITNILDEQTPTALNRIIKPYLTKKDEQTYV